VKFIVSDTWKATYPGASVGFLVMAPVANPKHHPALEARKEALEASLRTRYGDLDPDALKALPEVAAYRDYYGQFRKSYHVRMQLESVVHDGRSIPSVAALVEAMFMAELDTMLLTAGHDVDALVGAVRVDVADGTERYTKLNGKPQTCKAGDQLMADREGVISSILYGPDRRTRIRPETQRVCFAVYAPAGIGVDRLDGHLEDLASNVRVIVPDAETIQRLIISAESEN
jgi:DNA/RNA-binding domain of Phe-tRNA-synthetase-like protein